MAAPFLPDPDDLYPDHQVDVDAELARLAPDHDLDEPPAAAFLRQELDDRDDVWTIVDDSAADWAMGKLAEASRHLAQLVAQHDEYVDRAHRWLDRASRGPARTHAYFEAQLQLYALRRRSETGGKVKTVTLPSGEVRTRKPGAPRPVIVDEAALIEWAERHCPGIVQTRKSVTATALRSVAQVSPSGRVVFVHPDTGAMYDVPGTAVGEGEGSATVKPYETE